MLTTELLRVLAGRHSTTFDEEDRMAFTDPFRNGAVHALVALPGNNPHALSGSEDHTIKLFNFSSTSSTTVVRTFTHHTGPVRCLALMPDGRSFVSGSDDMTVRIVDLQA